MGRIPKYVQRSIVLLAIVFESWCLFSLLYSIVLGYARVCVWVRCFARNTPSGDSASPEPHWDSASILDSGCRSLARALSPVSPQASVSASLVFGQSLNWTIPAASRVELVSKDDASTRIYICKVLGSSVCSANLWTETIGPIHFRSQSTPRTYNKTSWTWISGKAQSWPPSGTRHTSLTRKVTSSSPRDAHARLVHILTYKDTFRHK